MCLFCRCMEENTPILEELIALRQKQADLLGYKSHAHYVLEERMAKNPENVAEFLSNLSKKLQPLWKDEQVVMQKFKKEEVCAMYSQVPGHCVTTVVPAP